MKDLAKPVADILEINAGLIALQSLDKIKSKHAARSLSSLESIASRHRQQSLERNMLVEKTNHNRDTKAMEF